MRVCEACAAKGYTERIYHGNPIRVLCGSCLGVGSISLGYESHAKWNQLRQIAVARGQREGWFDHQWAGKPGEARKVLLPMAAERKAGAA